MSDKEKELSEDELKEATGGRRTAQGELGSNKNPKTRDTGSSGGGVFTGGGDITLGDELDPPYHTR